jgi:hypothetical protein
MGAQISISRGSQIFSAFSIVYAEPHTTKASARKLNRSALSFAVIIRPE